MVDDVDTELDTEDEGVVRSGGSSAASAAVLVPTSVLGPSPGPAPEPPGPAPGPASTSQWPDTIDADTVDLTADDDDGDSQFEVDGNSQSESDAQAGSDGENQLESDGDCFEDEDAVRPSRRKQGRKRRACHDLSMSPDVLCDARATAHSPTDWFVAQQRAQSRARVDSPPCRQSSEDYDEWLMGGQDQEDGEGRGSEFSRVGVSALVPLVDHRDDNGPAAARSAGPTTSGYTAVDLELARLEYLVDGCQSTTDALAHAAQQAVEATAAADIGAEVERVAAGAALLQAVRRVVHDLAARAPSDDATRGRQVELKLLAEAFLAQLPA